MPVLVIHLLENSCSDAQCEALLLAASRLYAQVLNSPIERVRAFITPHRAAHVAVGGVMARDASLSAPYFEFLVLEGRSIDERQQLLAGFTELIVNELGVERHMVRGGCWPIAPENWAIGGVPASELRAGEVRARAVA